MKRFLPILIASLLLAGCSSDGEFTQTEWDDFFEWCIELEKTREPCGEVADRIDYWVDRGYDEDCVVRIWKRFAVGEFRYTMTTAAPATTAALLGATTTSTTTTTTWPPVIDAVFHCEHSFDMWNPND